MPSAIEKTSCADKLPVCATNVQDASPYPNAAADFSIAVRAALLSAPLSGAALSGAALLGAVLLAIPPLVELPLVSALPDAVPLPGAALLKMHQSPDRQPESIPSYFVQTSLAFASYMLPQLSSATLRALASCRIDFLVFSFAIVAKR